MGVITDLIRTGQAKKQRDQDNQLRAFELAAKSDDPQLSQWGISSLTDLGQKHAPNPEVKKHIPILGQLAGMMKQMNPVPKAPEPSQGPAPKYDQQRADAERMRQATLKAERDSAINKQAERDHETATQMQIQNETDTLKKALDRGEITEDQYKEGIAKSYGVGTSTTLVKPADALHFKGADGKITILYPRAGGGLQNAMGKAVEQPQGSELIDKPANPKEPSEAEKQQQEIHTAYAQLLGKPIEQLTAADKLRADQWAKEDQVTKKRVDINMRKGMKFEDAWAKAQEAEVKMADTRQTAANVTITNAQANNEPMAPQTKSFLAGLILAGKPIPYGLLRGMSKKASANLLAELPDLAAAQGMSVGDVIAKQADIKALEGSLNSLQKQYDATATFEKTAQANLDRAIAAAGKLVDAGSPLVNKPWRMVEKDLLGKPEYAAFHAARVVAFTEVSKVVNGSLGNGAVSDSARKEADTALGENATLEQLHAAADILKADMASRTSNMRETIAGIKAKIGAKPGGQTPVTAPSGGGRGAPAAAAPKSGKDYAQRILGAGGGQ